MECDGRKTKGNPKLKWTIKGQFSDYLIDIDKKL